MQNGSYNTYTSSHRLWHRAVRPGPFRWWGAISASQTYSKYLTVKGQMTLSRTKNKKYLPQSEMRNEGIDVTLTPGLESTPSPSTFVFPRERTN